MIFVYKTVRTRILASGVNFMTRGPNNWNKQTKAFNVKLSVNILLLSLFISLFSKELRIKYVI